MLGSDGFNSLIEKCTCPMRRAYSTQVKCISSDTQAYTLKLMGEIKQVVARSQS